MLQLQLGDKVRDKLTKFEGVVTGKAEYLYEAPSALVQPDAMDSGKPVAGTWLSLDRLEASKPANGAHF